MLHKHVSCRDFLIFGVIVLVCAAGLAFAQSDAEKLNVEQADRSVSESTYSEGFRANHAESSEKWWKIRLQDTISYDDNLLLVSDEEDDDVDEDDFVNVVNFDATIDYYRVSPWKLGVRYNFYNSNHFAIEGLDLMGHTLSLYGMHAGTPLTFYGLMAPAYFYLDGDKEGFLRAFTGLGSVFWQQHRQWLGQGTYMLRYSNYVSGDDSDGAIHTVSWKEMFLHGDGMRKRAFLEGIVSKAALKGNDEEYLEGGVRAGYTCPLPWELELDTSLTGLYRLYDNENSIAGKDQKDTRVVLKIQVDKPFLKYWTAGVSVSWSEVVSNIDDEEYSKHSFGVSIGAEF